MVKTVKSSDLRSDPVHMTIDEKVTTCDVLAHPSGKWVDLFFYSSSWQSISLGLNEMLRIWRHIFTCGSDGIAVHATTADMDMASQAAHDSIVDHNEAVNAICLNKEVSLIFFK